MDESDEEDQGLLGFPLLVAQGSATIQPARSGGVISINHTNLVAAALREEMHAMRTDLDAKFNQMKIEFEVKMSGRKGTGHYESGSIETLIEKNNIIEQKIKDIEINMNDIKDIKEAIKNDEKIADLIKKYKDIGKEDTLNVHMTDDIKKLKEYFDKQASNN